MIALEA
jgi:hypothetical protein